MRNLNLNLKERDYAQQCMKRLKKLCLHGSNRQEDTTLEVTNITK